MKFNINLIKKEDNYFAGKNKNSFWKSNLIVALLFGLWHFVMPLRLFINGEINFISLIIMILGYILLAGIMSIKWGMLYQITGSLWMGIGDHLLNNVIATNLLHVITNTGADEWQIGRILIAQIISFLIVSILYQRRKLKTQNNIDK